MRQTSSTYKALLAAQGTWQDFKVTNKDTDEVYGISELRGIKIWSGLFKDKGPAIGGTVSTKAEVLVDCDKSDWPRMSKFEIAYRLVSEDDQTHSEWILLGTFWTDTRVPNANNETLTVTGYDGMLLLEQTWTDKVNSSNMPVSWPITAQAAVTMAVGTTSFTLDPRTVLDNTTAFIGLDTKSTVRDVLAAAAAGCGGSWCLTPDNKLRLIPLKLVYNAYNSAIAGIAIAGRAVVGTSAGAGSVYPLGKKLKKMSIGEKLAAISGVKLTSTAGDEAKAGTASTYMLNGNCDFSSSAAASLCLTKTVGFQYAPYEISGAWLDPACELGDFVLIDGEAYPIYMLNWSVGGYLIASISAPFEAEIESEYQHRTEAAKNLQTAMQAVAEARELAGLDISSLRQELNSEILQSASEIRSEVSESYFLQEDASELQDAINGEIESVRSDFSEELENYYTGSETETLVAGVRTEVSQTASTLEVSITNVRTEANGGFNEIKQYVRFVNGVIILGATNSNSDLRISIGEISMNVNGVKMTYWNQNEQVTPKKLRIPVGGSLQEGDFIWQPRSSGNLSLMYVGGED